MHAKQKGMITLHGIYQFKTHEISHYAKIPGIKFRKHWGDESQAHVCAKSTCILSSKFFIQHFSLSLNDIPLYFIKVTCKEGTTQILHILTIHVITSISMEYKTRAEVSSTVITAIIIHLIHPVSVSLMCLIFPDSHVYIDPHVFSLPVH